MKLTFLSKKIENLIKNRLNDIDITIDENNSHVKLLIISDIFEKKSLIERHNIIHDILGTMIDNNEIHALSIKTYTRSEYKKIYNE